MLLVHAADVDCVCSTESLRVLVNVSLTNSQTPPNGPPILQGQTQALMDTYGFVNITSLSLSAEPGTYNLTVSLPDYPEVRISPLHAYQAHVMKTFAEAVAGAHIATSPI